MNTAETVDFTTGEIATVDATSEIAVTSYLQQARDWLATAVESTGPEQIARMKAEVITAAEMAKQLGLSKEIQQDAQEMVRRAEYALAKAVRLGQERGEIASVNSPKNQAPYSRVRLGQEEIIQPQNREQILQLPTPTDFFSNDQQRSEAYAMTDGVSVDQFEEAISTAKAEGNLSRANVVRKVKGYAADDLATRAQRAEAIRELADKGWSSAQMVDRVGVVETTIRQIARDYGIPIPADRTLHKQRRVNSNDIVDNLVIGLEGSAMSLDLVDLTSLDAEQAAYWATSLTESLKKLNRFAKQIKEMTHEHV